MRRPRSKRKGRKRQRFKVEERAAPSRRCVPPEVPHSTTWTLQGKKSGLQFPAQHVLRTRAEVQESLAQANILHSSGRRGWRTWVTGDVGSYLASSVRRQRGLRSSALRGPVLPPPKVPRAPVHAISLGPAPSVALSE